MNNRYSVIAIILFVFTIFSCKDDQKKTEEELARKRDSLQNTQITKKILSDPELVQQTIRNANKKLKSGDSIYFQGSIIRSSDSLMLAVNLEGKAALQGKVSTFDKTLFRYDDHSLGALIDGKAFRIDEKSGKNYFAYTIDEKTHNINSYVIDAAENPVSISPTDKAGNYFYDLLTERKFYDNITDKDRFFKIRKSRRILNDSTLIITNPGANIYTADKPFLTMDTNLSATPYYFVTDSTWYKKLIIKGKDSLFGQMILSGRKKLPKGFTSYSSEFKNDSIFVQHVLTEKLTTDNKHLVEYTVDSVVNTFLYDRQFQFISKSSVPHRFKRSYPQYYRELKDTVFQMKTDSFAVNGRKAYWKFDVQYSRTSRPSDFEVNVLVRQKLLMDASNDRVIFRVPRSGQSQSPVPISTISDSIANESFADLNFDGLQDLSFKSGTDNNGNSRFTPYLYNPANGLFTRNAGLEGTSLFKNLIPIEKARAILYSSKTGDQSFSAIVLNLNTTGEIASKQIFWTSGKEENIQIHYQRMKDNMVLVKKDDLLPEKEWYIPNFKNDFYEWVIQYITETTPNS
ncbi:XAC2610-related protein [Robertkochia solimangrovi]|uniref:XAC2610-related protein n=1 Tax=Robertkochia solimangrovi TaxID=2213046 RepID=UPI0011804C5F|nr:hypothetical protein [Robertkochia solimangrovi]TRZ43100.1 hypothetical protein DMZ48_10410 [Robertkochia solimangrovi]